MNFPASPTNGQVYSPSSGIVYVFNGVAWDLTTTATSSSGGVTVLTDSRTGVMIPGYIYPGNPYSDATFTGLLDMIRKYHAVPVLYIINPSSGPGVLLDGNYATAIKLLKAAGATVLGYVSTNYANRDPDLVKTDVQTWALMYANTPVDGIFYDEMPWALGTGNANITLYQEYYAWAYAKGFRIVVGNPGVNQQGAWYSADPPTADVIVTWENGTYPLEVDLWGNFVGGHVDYSYKMNAVLVHSQTWDGTKFQMMRKYAKWIWVTDDVLSPNPWDAFPTYMNTIFNACTVLPS